MVNTRVKMTRTRRKLNINGSLRIKEIFFLQLSIKLKKRGGGGEEGGPRKWLQSGKSNPHVLDKNSDNQSTKLLWFVLFWIWILVLHVMSLCYFLNTFHFFETFLGYCCIHVQCTNINAESPIQHCRLWCIKPPLLALGII